MQTQIYDVGTVTLDVTPPLGTYLAGFISRNEPASKIDRPLQATVTAIDDGTGPGIIVTIEWLGFYERTEHVRRLLQKATGVPPECIMLAASHTHGGPCVREMDIRRHGQHIDEAYLADVFERLADAGVQAIRDMRPSRLAFGKGWCGIAGSRRHVDESGKAQWKPTLDAPHDHTVPILVIEDKEGTIQHLMIGYACHPTGAGDLPHIGGGYAGYAIDYLRERFRCHVSFLQGCAGDQKPYAVDDDGNFRRLPVDECRELGRRLGQSVEREIRAGNFSVVHGPMTIFSRTISLTAVALPPYAYVAAMSSPYEYQQEWGKRYRDVVEIGALQDQELPFEIQTITFGKSLVMVGLAGEINVEHGLRLTRELGNTFAGVWPLGYTNNIIGYVPVRRQIPEGGYEVLDSNQCFQHLGPFADDTEEQIHATVHEMLKYA